MRIKAGNNLTGDRDVLEVVGASVEDLGPGDNILLTMNPAGAPTVPASDVPITDAGNLLDADTAEEAFAEIVGMIEDGGDDLTAHIADTTDAHVAEGITVDSTGLSGVATNVQASLIELDTDIITHLDDPAGAHAGGAISFIPTGVLSSTDVQAAIVEAYTDAAAAAANFSLPAAMATRYVAGTGVTGLTGSDSNNGLGPGTPFATIAAAYADLPAAGGNLILLPGRHNVGTGFATVASKYVHMQSFTGRSYPRLPGAHATTQTTMPVIYGTGATHITLTGSAILIQHGHSFRGVAFDMTNVNNVTGISCVDTNHVRVEDCTCEAASSGGVSRYFIRSTHPVFDDVSWYRITNNLCRNVGICSLNETGSGNCNNNVVMGNIAFGWYTGQFCIQMQTAQRSQVLWNDIEADCPGIRWYGSSHYNYTFFNCGEGNHEPFLQYDNGAWGNVHFNFGSPTGTGTNINDLDGANSAASGSQTLQRNVNSIQTKTASYTLDGIGGSFFGTMFNMNVASANTFTIDAQATEPVQIGAHLKVRQIGAGQTTMVAGAGTTFHSAAGLKTRAQYSVIEGQKIAANEWAIWGDTAV
jgi:hypothetical protein